MDAQIQPPAPFRFWRHFLPALAAVAFVFTAFPQLDIAISSLFFSGQRAALWPWLNRAEPLRDALNYASWAVLAGTVVYALVRLQGGKQRARAIAYVALCYGLAPGLIVNGLFKEHWGRARPNTVAEFGGSRTFTPALQPTNQCIRNCSFTSGEAALGFAAATPAALLTGGARVAMLAGGIGIGVALSTVRIVQGRHFTSDVLFSALIVWFIAWLSYGLTHRDWIARARRLIRRE